MQQGAGDNANGKTEPSDQVDVELKEQVDAQNPATDMEEEKDQQEEEDTKMGDAENGGADKEDQEYKPRSERNFRDVPSGPHLLVKLDRHEARVAVPAMVSGFSYYCFLHAVSDTTSRP